MPETKDEPITPQKTIELKQVNPAPTQTEYVERDPEEHMLLAYLNEYADLTMGNAADMPQTLLREARIEQLRREIDRLSEKVGKSPLEKITRSVVNRVEDQLGTIDYHPISRKAKVGVALTAATAAIMKRTPELVQPIIKQYRAGEDVTVREKKRNNLLEEAFKRGVPPGRIEGTFTKYEILNFMLPVPDFARETDAQRSERLKFARAARYMDAYVLEQGYTLPPIEQFNLR